MTDPIDPPVVEVAGLQTPADLAAQIIAGFREMYPAITDGKDDEAAVRACLIWFITSTLEATANRRARSALDAAVEQLRLHADAEAGERSQQIKAAVSRIKEKPTTPPVAE